MWHVRGTREVHARFWWGNVMERDHCGDPGLDLSIILKLLWKK
jgi:hypothetical protein